MADCGDSFGSCISELFCDGVGFAVSHIGCRRVYCCGRDVVVDLRKDSSTYKKWISIQLDAETKSQIYIPKGFGHACLSLVDDVEVQYKVSELYQPEYDRAIAWNDPELNIHWGIGDVIVSPKDMNAPLLADSDVNFKMENTK